MATLLLFVALLTFAAVAMWRLSIHIACLRRIGVGGPEEDLARARRIMLSVLISALVLMATIAVVVLVGERWAPQWRETPQGRGMLIVLCAMTGAGWLAGMACTLHQQWSARGSWRGLVRGVLYMGLATLAMMVSGRWLLL